MMRIPNNETNADQFENLLESLISKFNGKLYYHELIGILHMHATQLTLEAYSVLEEEEEEIEEDDTDGDEWKMI
tara:strand:- start:219 stop:440 length:222 start_codon:yes stop_codon:yes gene_type:complete